MPAAIALLRVDDRVLQHAALCLLRQLMQNDASVVSLARRELVVEPLVELLKVQHSDIASLAASIIGEAAAAGEQEFIRDVVHSRGLKLLLLLLRRPDRDSLVAASFALGTRVCCSCFVSLTICRQLCASGGRSRASSRAGRSV